MATGALPLVRLNSLYRIMNDYFRFFGLGGEWLLPILATDGSGSLPGIARIHRTSIQVVVRSSCGAGSVIGSQVVKSSSSKAGKPCRIKASGRFRSLPPSAGRKLQRPHEQSSSGPQCSLCVMVERTTALLPSNSTSKRANLFHSSQYRHSQTSSSRALK